MKKNVLSTMLLIAIAVLMISSTVLATAVVPPGKGDITPTGGAFTDVGGKVLGYVQWVGYAIAIGMLIYIGIKYTMASADGKADLKSAMIKYVIGAVLIGGATFIAGWFWDIGSGL